MESEYMDFGQALEMLNCDRMVARKGWATKNIFVFKQVPATISRKIVPNMQSLPDTVKKEFEARFNDAGNYQVDGIHYNNQLALVDSNNLITGWSPSVSDAMAEDWFEYGV